MVQTDLIGRYVIFPNDGDAGWIRAVYAVGPQLMVFVERDNVSRDFRSYFAVDMERAQAPKPPPVGP